MVSKVKEELSAETLRANMNRWSLKYSRRWKIKHLRFQDNRAKYYPLIYVYSDNSKVCGENALTSSVTLVTSTEEVMFSPVSVQCLVGLLDFANTTRWIPTELYVRMGKGSRRNPLNLGLDKGGSSRNPYHILSHCNIGHFSPFYFSL